MLLSLRRAAFLRWFCRKSRPCTAFLTRALSKWSEEITTDIKVQIENKWKKIIAESVNERKGQGPAYYVLSMFPYPSGNLHMGHARVYTISDSIAHFRRMCGFNVIHPMGWDAFGLPAENAAIERNIPPTVWTRTNIENMKTQLIDLGCFFDWEREVNTSDCEYYKWTQMIFLQLFKAGLAYKREAQVNWDPVDQTVLADEQVDITGCSWRSGAKVERKFLSQWFIKTTSYAKDLFDGLDTKYLDDWKDIIDIQKNWIGECNGTVIDFVLQLSPEETENIFNQRLTVWTSQPEILTCVGFITISPTHILNRKDFYKVDLPSYKELTLRAVNPLTGDILRIFVTDEIEYPEGADAHLGCPTSSHDDSLFLSKTGTEFEINIDFLNKSKIDREKLRKNVCDFLKDKNIGGYLVSSKLRDWLISRQRYWGTPIPIIYCDNCGSVPVPIEELPVTFPQIYIQGKMKTTHTLEQIGWTKTSCPNCSKEAKRETDTMDTFVDSSWYFLRYLDPHNDREPFNQNTVSKWFPVDLYIGGKEHAGLHLYYARFITHFLYSLGKVSVKEPFVRLLVQGMVMGKAFKVIETGKYIPESEVKIIDHHKGLAVTVKDNKKVMILWEKMSKSKYNGVNPTEVLKEYGCDTTRLFILGDVSPKSTRNWSSSTFPGILNWQKRLWCTVREFIDSRQNNANNEFNNRTLKNEFLKIEDNLKDIRNRNISYVTHCYDHTHSLSVAITNLQGITKSLRQKYPPNFSSLSPEYEKCLGCLIIMLAPMAPHFASELWSGFTMAPNRINHSNELFQWNKNVFQQEWPVVDQDYNLKLICKINGNDMGHIHLLPSELNQLTEPRALEEIFKNNKIGSKVKKQFVSKVSLDVFTNRFAVLNFIMDYNINVRSEDK